jgi:predicted flap endonuclease-1-like 5' DNA nuclease
MINLILAIDPFKTSPTGLNNVSNIETATVEIILMLLGAFLFGFLLRHLIGFFRKKEIIIDNSTSPEEEAMRANYMASNSGSTANLSAQIDALKAEVDRISTMKLCNCNGTTTSADDNLKYAPKNLQISAPILDVKTPEVKAEAKEKIAATIEVKTEKVKAEPKAKKEVVKVEAPKKDLNVKSDDLKIIEGVGPALEKLLNANGIFSFEQLSTEKVARLEKILDEAGPRFRVHVPETWPQQAKLLKENKMDEFKKLTEKLKGGRKI